MLKWFIKLRWKEATRSNIWQRNIAANIAIGFLVVLMFFYLLLLGIFIDKILLDLYPDREPAHVFNAVLIYYFMFDLFIRYTMQGLSTFNVESILHLPVKRSSVAHFMLFRSSLHLLNFLPLLVFIPFALKSLSVIYEPAGVISWIISMIFLILMNNFLATYLKRQLVSRAWITGIAALILIGIALLDRFEFIRLTMLSEAFFNALAAKPVLTIIPAFLAVIAYTIHYRFLIDRMYPEEVNRKKLYESSDIPRIRYLESLGLTGDLMMLEIKLWWRHKRTRSMVYLLPVFILYGLMFYTEPVYKTGAMIFVGLFMSGGMMMNYLNYAFGYESNYFDGILTRKIDMKRYIRAKLTISMLITTFCYILTVPYVLFGPEILLINTVTYLFNMGFLSFLLLYLATYNKLRMDLSKSSAFNYQGISAMNWLVMIPAFLLPVLLYLPFGLFGMKYLGLAIIGIIGILGLLFRKFWVSQIEKNFLERKYIMAQGFREG